MTTNKKGKDVADELENSSPERSSLERIRVADDVTTDAGQTTSVLNYPFLSFAAFELVENDRRG